MIRLTLPLTPLLNRYYRVFRNHMVIGGEGRAYKQEVCVICQNEGIIAIENEIILVAHVYRKRKAGDIDGYAKALLDCLNGRAYKDDKQIVELHLFRHDDKRNPRVEVTITEI